MRRILLIGALALALQVSFAGSAMAGLIGSAVSTLTNVVNVVSIYEDGDDLVVSLELGSDVELTDETGDLSYEVQEAVHAALSDTTKQSVDYFYVWIEVDGKRVLAVDPPAVFSD
ncbi:MAG: hypothetical protein WD535_06540 [Thermaerobacterales bacterium]